MRAPDRTGGAAERDQRQCAGCGSLLAVDNTAHLCSSCYRERHDQLNTPPKFRSDFFETDAFRAAFESHHMGKVFRAYRNHPRHLKIFGRALSQELLGRWLGLSQAHVSRLENGPPEQNITTLQHYAELLHLPHNKLWFAFPGERRFDSDVDDETTPVETGVPSLVSPSPVGRRNFLATSGAVVMDAALASVMPVRGAQFALSTPPHGHWSQSICNAVIDPSGAVRRATASLDTDISDDLLLRRRVDNVIDESLSSNYRALEQSLPGLIGLTEAVAMQPGGDDPSIQQIVSDLYAVAGWTLVKADLPGQAWIAAERAIQAAERADDVLRVAAATRCLAEVYMRAGHYEEATRTALLAAIHLESLGSRQTTALSLRGAALLSAAAASARRGDSREALASLKAASFCAAELGKDHSDLVTIFGPTNAAIHQVAIPIELGDARGAVNHISDVHFENAPEIFSERRARFLIDVARSYTQVNERHAAIDALVQAETIAPDELRNHRLTRELVPQLMAHESRNSGLRALAARCNLLR